MSGGTVFTCKECHTSGEYEDMPKGMDPRPGVFRVICRDCIDTIKQAQSKAQVFESFDGITFDPEQDAERLGEQMCRVLTVCLDDRWHTLSELSEKTGDPESSISARLRDVRKKWGKAAMESKRLKEGKGTWIYKVHVKRAA